MTSLDARRHDDTMSGSTGPPGAEPMSSRVKRGASLLVGAAAVLLLLQPIGSLPLKGWVPILIGLSYIAAGLLSGRRGLLLGPGVVLTAWGVAPLTTNYTEEFPGLFYLCLGTGLLIAALLAQQGWHRITPMSLALPVIFIGGTMFVSQYAGTWLTTILAVLLVGWGLWEMRPQSVRDRATAESYT